MKASLDNNAAPDFVRLEFECSDADGAMELVKRLDGALHTELCLEGAAGWLLIVGGGPERYVTVKFDGVGSSFAYTNPEIRTTQKVHLCVGGQPGDYEPNLVCPLALIEEAVRGFFAEPSANGGRWRRD